MRMILLFVVALLAVYFVRRMLEDKRGDGAGAGASAPPSSAQTSETMRACARCGLVVPDSEGVEVGGSFFCGPEHARLGRSSDAS
jgi:uncharacterized protein